MSIINTDLFGWLGGLLTNTSLLPQIIKAVRTRSVNDLSISMFWVLFAGVLSWFVFGILRQDPVLIVMNFLSLCCIGTMIALYYHYRNKPSN